MTVDNPKDTQKEFEQWLQTQGFSVGNPFATSAADQEREYLSEDLFWPINGYDRIRGDETVIVFAPRGGGKSALRVRLAAISLPQDITSQTLTVEYTDFSHLSAEYERTQKISSQEHGRLLLRKTAVTLFDLCTQPDRYNDRRKRLKWIGKITAVARTELACFIHRHAPHLLQVRHIYKRLIALKTVEQLQRSDLETALREHTLGVLLAKSNWNESPAAALLVDLCDEQFCENDPLSQGEEFQELVDLLQLMDIKMVHFLVDRLDEAPLLVNDHDVQANVLEPLLAFLYLLELPHVGFKFFLSQSLQRVLTERTSIRRDRLLDRSLSISWEKQALQKLLDARLSFFSGQSVVSLRPLCTEEADALIEKELYTMAQGSPRRMLQAVYALFRAYYLRNEDTAITIGDWTQAKQKLMEVMPPIIRIELDKSTVTTATGPVKVTKTERQILRCLIEEGGDCAQDRLVRRVWETDDASTVGSETVGQAVRRLRAKLGDDSKTAVYLQTIRGYGFRLQYYESL